MRSLGPETGYALDSSWHAERERLESITSLYDPTTLALCRRLGVSDGWECLDVGAGTGTLALATTPTSSASTASGTTATLSASHP